ncbi:KpsF/GutQ family sugar-phosphate isomerase [Chitinophagaceae bacterium LB-8]|uniref:KpsF/GutQ family sugar-phosphate isomerase n=1 Tax=Paraflavisolibacter caeni TaxID=2982496 RepID=A0A9X3B9B6_9BACT|nr:KpsF/GutQ family sugar-phosphate isomerase [Paraflavisolibacter caeni]MCU7550971.1 KpsF/GutQ family sugar-phosphate isomerase [Paraflavisolibacter caeni]
MKQEKIIVQEHSIISEAIRTIEMEAEAIHHLSSMINDDFVNAIDALYNCKGRIVISGIGKSAIIAQKIVATLNSTGTPSIFLHAADAIHGDLGMVQQQDLVIIISKSGESPEIKVLVPLIKNFNNPLISIVGNTTSFLARHSDFVINTTVEQEACPNNLAPTTSTTAQLVMGDVIAVCLMKKKGFNVADFAKLHPGGALGKKLYLRVSDLYPDNEKPEVRPDHLLKEVILEMTKKRMGVTAVTSEDGTVLGIITDGDLRRMLERNGLENIRAKDIMTKNPKAVLPSEMAVNALDIMRKSEITHLVVSENGKYLGMIHLHDLVKEGLI